MGLITDHKFVLVSPSFGGGVEVETYESKLRVVLGLIDNGSIGEGLAPLSEKNRSGVWGDKWHKEALKLVAARIREIRLEIKDSEESERRLAKKQRSKKK